jgi:hypothetical protein
MFRSLIAIGLILCAAGAQAATVTSFVVRCIDRQEATNDDIFLAAVKDSQPVGWGKGDQAGTSVGNTFEMKEGSTLTLNQKSLSDLTFNGSLKIAVQEKDVTSNETFADINITPDDGTKNLVFKGKDWEYHVEYSVSK